MKLALLGCDDVSLAIARAAAAGGPHHIACLCEAADAAPLLRSLAPQAQYLEHWEALLAGSGCDAVVVAHGLDQELRAEQLRRLAQAAIPLLLCHPPHTSVLLCYELDMICRETGAILLPYLPARWHPAVARLMELTSGPAAGGLGPVSQVVFERAIAEPGKNDVLACFARDIDLARLLCGELTRVSSLAPAAAAASWSSLGVQLSGPGGALVRWTVEPAQAPPGVRLTLLGRDGKAVLLMPDADHDDTPWRLDVTRTSGQDTRESVPFDLAAAALAALEKAIAGQPLETGHAAQPDWLAATRSVELAEAVERSLAKGRTVELRTDEQSEEAAFKGVMAAVGCGLLIVGLVSVVVAAVAAQLGVRWAGYWLYVLCAVFGLFLLLQLFKLVVPRGPSTPPMPSGPEKM